MSDTELVLVTIVATTVALGVLWLLGAWGRMLVEFIWDRQRLRLAVYRVTAGHDWHGDKNELRRTVRFRGFWRVKSVRLPVDACGEINTERLDVDDAHRQLSKIVGEPPVDAPRRSARGGWEFRFGD